MRALPAAMVLAYILAGAALLLPRPTSGDECCDGPQLSAACTGSASCRVCRNCSSCAHCNGGGTCGVCAPRRPAAPESSAPSRMPGPARGRGNATRPPAPKPDPEPEPFGALPASPGFAEIFDAGDELRAEHVLLKAKRPGDKAAILCPDRATYEEYAAVLVAPHGDGGAAMVRSGRVREVPLPAEAILIARRADRVFVRLAGGKPAEADGWLSLAHVEIARPEGRDRSVEAKAAIDLSREDAAATRRVEAAQARRKAEATAKRADGLLSQARALAKAGKTAAAIRYYRDIIKTYPKLPQATAAQKALKKLDPAAK